MNAKLMRNYVEYVADFLLVELGLAPLFGKKNPVSLHIRCDARFV